MLGPSYILSKYLDLGDLMREMESDSHTPENQQFSTGNYRSLQTKSNEQLKTYPLTLSQQSTNRPQQTVLNHLQAKHFSNNSCHHRFNRTWWCCASTSRWCPKEAHATCGRITHSSISSILRWDDLSTSMMLGKHARIDIDKKHENEDEWRIMSEKESKFWFSIRCIYIYIKTI